MRAITFSTQSMITIRTQQSVLIFRIALIFGNLIDGCAIRFSMAMAAAVDMIHFQKFIGAFTATRAFISIRFQKLFSQFQAVSALNGNVFLMAPSHYAILVIGIATWLTIANIAVFHGAVFIKIFQRF